MCFVNFCFVKLDFVSVSEVLSRCCIWGAQQLYKSDHSFFITLSLGQWPFKMNIREGGKVEMENIQRIYGGKILVKDTGLWSKYFQT